jgi:hypothetical protein
MKIKNAVFLILTSLVFGVFTFSFANASECDFFGFVYKLVYPDSPTGVYCTEGNRCYLNVKRVLDQYSLHFREFNSGKVPLEKTNVLIFRRPYDFLALPESSNPRILKHEKEIFHVAIEHQKKIYDLDWGDANPVPIKNYLKKRFFAGFSKDHHQSDVMVKIIPAKSYMRMDFLKDPEAVHELIYNSDDGFTVLPIDDFQ